MKKNIILSIFAFSAMLFATSCSDVKYDNAPYSEPVSNLTTTIQKRSLILKWTNPAGATGAAIFKDGAQIAAVAAGVSEYEIKNADDNKKHYYTVKAIYDGKGVAEGVTDTITVPSHIKVGYLLTADDYTKLPDDDEVAAGKWFKENYVDLNTGVWVKQNEIATINLDDVSELWIQIDRVSLGHGVDKLPFSTAEITALQKFVQDGGKLFVTKQATQLVSAIGRIDSRLAPGIYSDGNGGEGGDVWCMNAQIGVGCADKYDHREHAIFTGLEAGDPNGYGFENYPIEGPGLREDHNCMWDLNAYGFSAQPNTVVNWETETKSTVLATWGHVQDYCCAGIVEFAPTDEYAGSIIAIGLSAYEFNQEGGNKYQSNIEKLTKNCIDYLK